MKRYTARPELEGTFGMVSSTHWIASAVGMSILERGGNAFDAAVAAGFTLQVVEPHMNGPGGDLVALVLDAKAQRVRELCGQGTAPQAATIERFRSLGLDLIPGTGLLPAVVPGAFDAWLLLLRDHGTMTLEEVLAPAIYHAENGWPMLPAIIGFIENVSELFRTHWTSSAAIWLPDGNLPQAGSLYQTPGMARTYRRIIDESRAIRGREAQIEHARQAWYNGFVAEEIDRFCQIKVEDGTGEPHPGLLTANDMSAWRASWGEPVSLDYSGFTIFKPGPWTQGPVFLQQLALLRGFDISAMGPVSAEFVHTIVECAKLAFADRDAFYGDPNAVDVPLHWLLSEEYNAERRRLIGDDASLALRPGRSEDGQAGWQDASAAARAKRAPEFALGAAAGEPTVRRDGATSGDTCHLDVVDRWGNMVAATPSGAWLQSSPAIPALGFCLGTRAQMFWLDERAPSALRPNTRPRTTLTATIALSDSGRRLGFGTPGGDQQDQWPLAFLLRHLHHGLALQESIEQPNWTSQHWPNSFWPRAANPGVLLIEPGFADKTMRELAERGHRLQPTAGRTLGRVSAVSQDGQRLSAGANDRGMQGYAVGR